LILGLGFPVSWISELVPVSWISELVPVTQKMLVRTKELVGYDGREAAYVVRQALVSLSSEVCRAKCSINVNGADQLG
jgi:hypothetical protein